MRKYRSNTRERIGQIWLGWLLVALGEDSVFGDRMGGRVDCSVEERLLSTGLGRGSSGCNTPSRLLSIADGRVGGVFMSGMLVDGWPSVNSVSTAHPSPFPPEGGRGVWTLLSVTWDSGSPRMILAIPLCPLDRANDSGVWSFLMETMLLAILSGYFLCL